VAPGAGGYIDAKVNGTKQLFMVMTDHYPRPITADHKVPVASRTCLNCHNARAQMGDKLLVTQSFADDAPNTQTSSVTVLHVGGVNALGQLSGIHGAHLKKIEYISSDNDDQTIPWVRETNPDGSTSDFIASGVNVPVGARPRVMDCIGCHNRAAHSFDTAEGALGKMMAQGSPDASLPFLHKEGLLLLNTKYDTRDNAKAGITTGLINFYRSQYPAVWNAQQAQVRTSADTLAKIYADNVFPAMNVRWGTHPNNIGHTDTAGCFRCHDGNHTSKSGVTITNDCSVCHNLVVSKEAHPKLLTDLGMH
jgi:hypothetical protein